MQDKIIRAIMRSGMSGVSIAKKAGVAYATYIKWKRDASTVRLDSAARLYAAVGLEQVVREIDDGDA